MHKVAGDRWRQAAARGKYPPEILTKRPLAFLTAGGMWRRGRGRSGAALVFGTGFGSTDGTHPGPRGCWGGGSVTGFGPRAAVQVDAPWPSDRTDVGKAHCRSLKKNRPVSGETGRGCRSVGAAAIRTDVEVLAVLLGLCQAFRSEKESTNSYEYPFMMVTIPPVQPHHCSLGGRLASAVSAAAVRQKGASFCLSTALL